MPDGTNNNLIPGLQRFGEFHKTIPGIALKVLSGHLKELEADGIINRKVYAEVPPKVEYFPTEKGPSLNKIIQLLSDRSRGILQVRFKKFKPI